MTDRKITHEVKLQKSVIVILAVLATGVLVNAFAPALDVKSALAQMKGGSSIWLTTPSKMPFEIKCTGCK